MKRLLIGALALLPLCGTVSAQSLIVNMKNGDKTEIPVADIDYMEFDTTPVTPVATSVALADIPDETFRSCVAAYDTDGDEILSAEELAAVEELSLNYKTFESMEGIQYFTSVKKLSLMACSKLTSLDLSALKNLEYLHVGWDSLLTDIVLGEKPNLKELYINYSGVENIDLAGTGALEYFYAASSKVPALDLTNNPNLVEISVGSDSLTDLNIDGLDKLTKISVYKGSNFNSFDCAQYPLLEDLYLENYTFEEFTTDAPELKKLSLNYCSNLTKLDLSKSLKLSSVQIYGSYELAEVWMMEGQSIASYSFSDSLIKRYAREYPEDVATVLDDETFRTFMIGVADTDGDGKISETEAKAVTVVNGASQNLTTVDFTYFPNITELDLSDNSLETFESSALANVTKLTLNNNQLTSLDIAAMTGLEYLYANNNQLTAAPSFTGLSALIEVELANNQMTSISLTYKTHLLKVNVANNQLSSASILGHDNLTDLDVSGNQITSMTLWSLKKLQRANFSSNPFTQLDESNRWTDLRSIDVSGTDITILHLGPCHNLEKVRAINCPNLATVEIYMDAYVDRSECDSTITFKYVDE